MKLCRFCSQPLKPGDLSCPRCGGEVPFARLRGAWRSLTNGFRRTPPASPSVRQGATGAEPAAPTAGGLMPCPACKHEVSSAARACPNCGHPFKAVTTERTSKGWKLVMLSGIVLMVVGFFSCLSSPARPPAESPEELGHRIGEDIALFIVGVLVLVIGKLGAWWHHG